MYLNLKLKMCLNLKLCEIPTENETSKKESAENDKTFDSDTTAIYEQKKKDSCMKLKRKKGKVKRCCLSEQLH